MPANFITDGMDILSGGSLIGGLVAIVTTFGWWLRRERVESARANNIVAANNASTDTYEAQSKELASLRERLSTLERAYVALQERVNSLVNDKTELESRLLGASIHKTNLILCDVCTTKNETIMDALNKSLDRREQNRG